MLSEWLNVFILKSWSNLYFLTKFNAYKDIVETKEIQLLGHVGRKQEMRLPSWTFLLSFPACYLAACWGFHFLISRTQGKEHLETCSISQYETILQTSNLNLHLSYPKMFFWFSKKNYDLYIWGNYNRLMFSWELDK